MRIRTLSSHSKYSDPSWVGNFVRRPEERCCGDGSYFSLTLWLPAVKTRGLRRFQAGIVFLYFLEILDIRYIFWENRWLLKSWEDKKKKKNLCSNIVRILTSHHLILPSCAVKAEQENVYWVNFHEDSTSYLAISLWKISKQLVGKSEIYPVWAWWGFKPYSSSIFLSNSQPVEQKKGTESTFESS